jgi:hypothetical protein
MTEIKSLNKDYLLSGIHYRIIGLRCKLIDRVGWAKKYTKVNFSGIKSVYPHLNRFFGKRWRSVSNKPE